MVLIQLTISFLIYTFGSFETVLSSKCSFNTKICFWRIFCFHDFNLIGSICEKSIIFGLALFLILFFGIVSYFQLGYFGMGFFFILIFYYKKLILESVFYIGILFFFEFLFAYFLSGKKWIINGRDFKILMNGIFMILSSFFWFYLTIFLSSNKHPNCANIQLWNQCDIINKLFKQ